MKVRRMLAIGAITILIVGLVPTHSNMTSFAAQHNGKNNDQQQSNGETSNSESNELARVNSKSEVIYAKLTAEGTSHAVYVVNHFEVGKGGKIIDFGDYQSVQNLTDVNPLTLITDEVSFQAMKGNFYYQGNMKATDLPWNFKITYVLNDQLITANELAGKSGKLKIQITSEQNSKVSSEFYESYMLQISLTLNNEKISNINADGAIIAEAGNNTMLNFTVMPKKDADIVIECNVNEFEMNGIEISAMPFSFSMELPDTDTMLKDFHKLPQAISDLNDGVGDLADGTAKLSQGAIELRNGSKNFESGMAELKNNSTQITEASSQISTALTTISASIPDNSNKTDLTQVTQLPIVLTELSTGIKGISNGMNQLKESYSKAYTALDTAIMAIQDTTITTEQIKEQFPEMKESQQKLLDQLYASYVAGQTVKGTYQLSKLAFAQVETSLETLSANLVTITGALDEMSINLGGELSSLDISTQLGQLTQGLTQLASKYTEFDKGLKEYMEGLGQLADGYNQFDSGLTEYVSGVELLDQGVITLHKGTVKFNEEAAKLPEQMQAEIDQLMKDYSGTKVDHLSFVSQNNINTDLVQFVLKCDDIKIPSESVVVSHVEEDVTMEETVWDRLVALFH